MLALVLGLVCKVVGGALGWLVTPVSLLVLPLLDGDSSGQEDAVASVKVLVAVAVGEVIRDEVQTEGGDELGAGEEDGEDGNE